MWKAVCLLAVLTVRGKFTELGSFNVTIQIEERRETLGPHAARHVRIQ